ncbi:hypothetical protein LZF95_16545 [Algoriphagus sp. AGSA1]|uniref:hypothetical protein n=1 Tax=unclassified Algoriphagus TaxID=2641541 RepID=UPI0017836276|nr:MULTISPECIES: hypothetical protein [unclassified Algoriphagus]MCE7056293.1 hypothetical protein [Algoriphagus sp. AGSA1]
MKSKILPKSFLLFQLLSWILLTEAFGQLPSDVQTQVNRNFPKPIQKSPNASGIERYGNYHVNLYTGVPNISIPLYTVEAGPIKLPISLNYHSSGIKYTDQASWAGLGWSVIAGGQITRQIQRMSDDLYFFTASNNYSVGNYCTGVTQTDKNNWLYKKNSVQPGYDREADIFSYSFPGKSGKFYLRQNGQAPYLFPEAPIKLVPGASLNFFDITDENGIRYRFGRNSANSNYTESTTTSGGGGSSVAGRTAWYLVEIFAPNSDDKVEITYQPLGSQSLVDIEHNITVIDQCNTTNPSLLPCRSGTYIQQEVNTSSHSNSLGIDEIKYKTGKVKFIINTAKRSDLVGLNALDRIEIYSKTGTEYTLIKTYQLTKSYFTGVSRLKLDELIERDGANTVINKQSFSYHTTSFSWDQANNSKRRDWFGFYNGKTNTSLIPQQTIQYQPNTSTALSNITIGSANRESDTTFLKEGMLKRITHPTKGYTEFFYEPHKYLDGTVTKYGGGLRIKKITNTAGSVVYTKEYRYGEGESGTGTKNFTQSLFYFVTESQSRTGCEVTNCSRRDRIRMFYSNSAIGAGYDDSPVVYLKVSEYENINGTNGKTLYEFDNNIHIPDMFMIVPFSNKTHRNSSSWERGKLTKKTVKNAAGTDVSQTVIAYTKLKGQNAEISQAVIQYIDSGYTPPFNSTCIDENGTSVDVMTYQIRNLEQQTGLYVETSRTESIINTGGAFTTTTLKSYDPTYLQLTQEEVRVSTNPEVVVTRFRYPFQVINPATTYTGYPNILKQLTLKNILKPVEQYTLIQNLNGTSAQVVGSQLTYFKTQGSYYVPEAMYFLELAAPITLSSFAPLAVSGTSAVTRDSRYQPRLTFSTYDTRGNITTFNKSNAQPNSFIWAYDGAYPIAEAKNAIFSQIAYTSFETNEKGGWNYSGPETVLRWGEARTGRNAYSLSGGAVTRTVTGASTSNKFKLSFWAKVPTGSQSWTFMGATETLSTTWKLIERDVTSTSLSISGTNILIDEIRIHPPGSEMNTYTYVPGVGQWSQVDAKNHAVVYKYDRLGRLETILNNDGHILSHYEYNFIK